MAIHEPDNHAPSAWRGDLPVTSRYTAGLAGERFFRAIQEQGTIMGARCEGCARTYVPAVLFCERCLGELGEWLDVGTTGEVHTFTLLAVNYDGSPRDEPEIVAFIKMGDGGLVHRLGEIDPQEVAIGLPVQAVFKPQAERQGAITDITHFRPVAEQPSTSAAR